MSDSKNGPVTTVSNKSAEEAKKTRDRAFDFNRWEKEFLNLAFPVMGKIKDKEGNETEGLIAYDLFPHVPTHTIDAEAQLLASFDDAAKTQWATTPDVIKKLALEAFSKSLPKSEFPNNGKLDDLPDACMRIHPYGGWELFARNAERGVSDHIAILATKFAEQIKPRLEKHRRSVDVLGTMIEAFGFYMASAETNEKGEETGNWTSRTRRENEDLAADLHAAKLPGK